MRDGELVLVTGRDCHLCDHARAVLENLSSSVIVREVDVESADAQALGHAGVPLAFLPVLLSGTQMLGYGRLSERRLRRLLAR